MGCAYGHGGRVTVLMVWTIVFVLSSLWWLAILPYRFLAWLFESDEHHPDQVLCQSCGEVVCYDCGDVYCPGCGRRVF